MNDNSMAAFRCWSASQIAQTVFSDIGALAGDADALFLAAHTPMELEHRKGAELGGGDSGEARVLEALTSRIGDIERNTLVAVTGSSGSGKSHVVRWVRAHLPPNDSRFQLLYVPRAVQTLRELLRKVIEGLPGVEGAELMNRVDSAFAGVKPGELQERLVSEMKIALNWTIDDRAPYDGETSDEAAAREDRNNLLGTRDEKGGRSDGLADLLDIPAFKESLLRPEGPLGQLIQSYFTKTSRRMTTTRSSPPKTFHFVRVGFGANSARVPNSTNSGRSSCKSARCNPAARRGAARGAAQGRRTSSCRRRHA